MPDLTLYPGGDLVEPGLADLRRGVASEEAFLVSMAAPPLRRLGFDVPTLPDPPLYPGHVLFALIEERLDRGAHAAYNALLARMTGFVQAYGRVPVGP